MCWKTDKNNTFWGNGLFLIAALFLVVAVSACDGGSGGSDGDTPPPVNTEPTNFNIVYERQLTEDEAGGILTPQVTAKVDGDGLVHLYYYTTGEQLDITNLPAGSDIIPNTMRFYLHHDIWNPNTNHLVSEELVPTTTPYTNDSPSEPDDFGLDNANIIRTDFYNGRTPLIVYQGGARPQSADGLSCNPYYQGDLMVAVRNNGVWQEYLGIQGDAGVKNPLYIDGQMGFFGDLVVGSDGVVHMIAQHYYEYCDLIAITFPDLLYVQQTITEFGNFDITMEEWVDEHNEYGAGGGAQNAMGYHCKLVLDPDNQPVAVYFAVMVNGDRVIRASRRVEGEWIAETVTSIEDDYDVGYISAAIADDGTIGVAYFLQRLNEDAFFLDHLRYTTLSSEGEWETSLVDYASYCGNYCTLTFDANQQPAIAYIDKKPYTEYRMRNNAKLARLVDGEWKSEFVATDGEVGFYNSLWFGVNNRAFVCTYDQEIRAIRILREIVNAGQ